MSSALPGWKAKRYDDGQEVLLKRIRTNGLQQSFAYAYHVAETLFATKAAHDFSVSANPAAVFIVLHAYSKGDLPEDYEQIALRLNAITL